MGGGGGGLVVDGAFGIHHVWRLLSCLPHCVLLGLFPPPCVGRPCSQLVGCVHASELGGLVSFVGALAAAGLHCGGAVYGSLLPMVWAAKGHLVGGRHSGLSRPRSSGPV